MVGVFIQCVEGCEGMIGLHSPFVCCLIKFTKSLEKSSAGILAKICVCLMQNSKSEDISSAFSLFSPFLHQKFCHDAQWYKKDKPFRTFWVHLHRVENMVYYL